MLGCIKPNGILKFDFILDFCCFIQLTEDFLFFSGVIKCPACLATVRNHHFPPVEVEEELDIRSPLTNEMMPFNDAIIAYIKHYFPTLHKSTYRVPAAMFYESKGDLDLWTNVDIASNKMPTSKGANKKSPNEVIADRFQKDAVERVVSALYSWGVLRGEVMFILSEYKFQSYCKLSETMKSKKINGEHDVLIFHRKLGIILVEVKSVTSERAFKTKRGNIRSAWEQALRNEIAIRDMNSALDFVAGIPAHQFIAFPNLNLDDLEAVNVCDYHMKRTLYSDNLRPFEKLNATLCSYLMETASPRDEAMTLDQYEQLCARYAGFASIAHVRTVGDAVKKTSAKMNKFFLNPEQVALLAVPVRRKLVLTGEYGTGKSLVLKVLAENLRDTDTNYCVVLVSCTNVSHTRTMGRLRRSKNHLVEHIQQLLVPDTKFEASDIRVWSLSDLLQLCFPEKNPFSERLSPSLICEIVCSLTAMYPNKEIVLLLDEVPFVPSWDWEPLEALCREYVDFHLWMTITTGTYAIRANEDPISVVKSNSPTGFHFVHLRRCMRMTCNGLRFYKALQALLGDNAHLSMEYGNAIEGPIPRWYELPSCNCRSMDPFDCKCIDRRMDKTLQCVWDQLVDINPSDVTFVVRDSVRDTDRFLNSLLVRSCQRLKIPLQSFLSMSSPSAPGDIDDKLSCRMKCPKLVDIFSFKGCESPIVIFVTPFGWPLVWEHNNGRHGWDDISPQISRALGQIILITWPKEEMDYFSLQAVEGTIESYSQDEHDDTDKCEKDFVDAMVLNLKKVMEIYQNKESGVYLNVLVEQGVLVKFSVPSV